MSSPPAPTRVDVGIVVSVHASAEHTFSKQSRTEIELAAVVDRAPDGSTSSKTGVMGVVVPSGRVRPGGPISVACPPPPWEPFEPV